jgi:endonuclease/exonuclease/phosphatase (EEP) superfamily protein YafD
VIGLVEVDDRWLTHLAPALQSYPQQITAPRSDNFGVALFTALPMTGAAESLGSDVPTVVATVERDGTPLRVVLTHPLPPVGPSQFASQVGQLAVIARRARTEAAPLIVMGDFNATPWSRPFRDFVATSGLCDTRAGFGSQASFPADSTLLRIPIDHVLVSCTIGVRSRSIERDVGSDHLPVLVDLVIPY